MNDVNKTGRLISKWLIIWLRYALFAFVALGLLSGNALLIAAGGVAIASTGLLVALNIGNSARVIANMRGRLWFSARPPIEAVRIGGALLIVAGAIWAGLAIATLKS